MKPSSKSASKTSGTTPPVNVPEKGEKDVAEDEDAEDEEAAEEEEEKKPTYIFAREMVELINTEMKASRVLSFVLQELLQYQDDVTEMVASCGNVVEIALEVVPPMKTFVELSIMKGLKQGVLFTFNEDEEDENEDEDNESVEKGDEVLGAVEADKDGDADADADADGDGDGDGADDNSEKESEGSLPDEEEEKEDDTQYDHIPINLEGFLAICMSFCKLNPQSPLHQQLFLLEKKFIPFKKEKTAVNFK